MNLTKEQAKQELQKLVDLFEKEMKSGEAMELNEANTKSTFIEPLLRLLGWDTNNHNEVCLEDAISRKRVDYSVRYNGRVEFFVEAKQVSVNLEDKKFINQAIGYGYSRKDVPFVVLTDFEGFKLFDVTVKPDIRNIRKGIKLDLNWKQYVDKFDDLWMLSKESVINGDLNKLLSTKPKDRVPVDKAVLNDLKVWREHLAKDIYKNNPDLFHSGDLEHDADYLKEINQKLLDRIVFMRSCEDRGLVSGHSLKALFEDRNESLSTRTMQVILDKEFAFYNRTFDSELFRPQDWEKDLKIEFKTFNAIIEDTYNPYQFDAIPLEVLGNIYEQFLGYTIRVTDKQVKYEEKPDVRKAGGVYYTPEYIVDYIVKNTVGKKLAELKEKDIKKLRILDPACGSGSFLIRAYEEMLNWYRDLKRKQSTEKADKQSQDRLFEQGKQQGDVLNIAEKAEILKRHIFGVDLDEQAVEVTKLSLVLKMLEGEFVPIGGQGVLPMLNQNIKCGNSLISGDPLLLTRYFGNDYYKIKPFNWEEQYKEVMAEGGFDCVIGNPPYSLLQEMENGELFTNFVKEIFYVAQYKIDTYHLFIEQSIKVMKNGALFGFITPNTYLMNKFTTNLRKLILDKTCLKEVIILPEKVFEAASVDTCITIFEKDESIKKRNSNTFIGIELDTKSFNDVLNKKKELSQNNVYNSENQFINIQLDERVADVVDLINLNSIKLGEFATAYFGIQTFDRKKYVVNKKINTFCKPILDGGNFEKYKINFGDEYVIFKPENIKSGGKEEVYKKDRIIVRQIGRTPIATLDKGKYFTLNTVYNIYMLEEIFDLRYILAIINSKLIMWYWKNIFSDGKETFPKVKKESLLNIPIKKIDTKSKEYLEICSLVDLILDKPDDFYENQTFLDVISKIDNILYRIYKIDAEEFKKVIEARL